MFDLVSFKVYKNKVWRNLSFILVWGGKVLSNPTQLKVNILWVTFCTTCCWSIHHLPSGWFICFEVATVAAEAIREELETRMSPQHDLIMNRKYNSFIYRVIHIELHFKFSEVHHQSSNCHTQIHRVLQHRTPRCCSTHTNTRHWPVKWCKLQQYGCVWNGTFGCPVVELQGLSERRLEGWWCT